MTDLQKFLSCLGMDVINKLLPDGKYLFVMLSKIKPEDRPALKPALIEVIGESQFTILCQEETAKDWIAEMLGKCISPKNSKELTLLS